MFSLSSESYDILGSVFELHSDTEEFILVSNNNITCVN